MSHDKKPKRVTWKRIKDKLKRMVLGTSLVNTRWLLQLKLANLFTRKIRVGFGPVTTGEDDLAERKWRIDPIVNLINRKSKKYCAGIFFEPAEMKHFDVVVIVKKFNPFFVPVIERLKRDNKRFIYDIVDNPNSEEKYRFYFADHPEFCRLMDGFILSSPLHQPLTTPYSSIAELIEHPIIHSEYKREYHHSDSIRILAHGYYANLINHQVIEPLLPVISKEIGKKVCLVYHSEHMQPDTEFVKYVRWTPENSFTEMVKADMAVTIKDIEAPHQKTKPSTKIIAFMAAGLPVICTPTEADKLVMEDGVTGFYAYTAEELRYSITLLAKDDRKREEIGRASREHVLSKYALDPIVDKYLSILDKTI